VLCTAFGTQDRLYPVYQINSYDTLFNHVVQNILSVSTFSFAVKTQIYFSIVCFLTDSNVWLRYKRK